MKFKQYKYTRYFNDTTYDNYVIVMKTTTVNESITIPMQGTANNYTVAWGDGVITSGHTATATHQYEFPGEYVITIDGEYSYIRFNATEPTKLLEIKQWGSNKWTSFDSSYRGCSNLRVTATDTPDISLATSFYSAFRNCSSLNFCMNTWDFSNVLSFQNMFLSATNFNNGGLPVVWNTNSATSFNQTFHGAAAFNQSLAGLNVSKATNLVNILFTTVGVENYSLSLIGWATQNVTTGAVLNVGTLKYNSSAIAARATLISKGWTITDGGLV